MNSSKKILDYHKNGKLVVNSKYKINDKNILSAVYTPGVAEVCKIIHNRPQASKKFTIKSNSVAVISDGSAVLGLGNIGAAAAIPVMEGKCALFKEFADIDAFPICLNTQNTNEIIKTIINISPVFGGINLEDISAPRCFEIEERLKQLLNIPVFHDDQHGTAVVVLAALINALKIVKKKIDEIKITVIGAGAAGTAIIKLLHAYGARNIIAADKYGVIYKTRKQGMNSALNDLCKIINPKNIKCSLSEAFIGSDVFIGVSTGNIVKPDWIKLMAEKPIVFAMANPMPEIMPDIALKAGAFIVGTGRSDFPNQINNVLCFPGLFRGLLDYNVKIVTDKIKISAAEAIAKLVNKTELSQKKIIPPVFDKRVARAVALAVKNAN